MQRHNKQMVGHANIWYEATCYDLMHRLDKAFENFIKLKTNPSPIVNLHQKDKENEEIEQEIEDLIKDISMALLGKKVTLHDR